jgi:hypothetical protein
MPKLLSEVINEKEAELAQGSRPATPEAIPAAAATRPVTPNAGAQGGGGAAAASRPVTPEQAGGGAANGARLLSANSNKQFMATVRLNKILDDYLNGSVLGPLQEVFDLLVKKVNKTCSAKGVAAVLSSASKKVRGKESSIYTAKNRAIIKLIAAALAVKEGVLCVMTEADLKPSVFQDAVIEALVSYFTVKTGNEVVAVQFRGLADYCNAADSIGYYGKLYRSVESEDYTLLTDEEFKATIADSAKGQTRVFLRAAAKYNHFKPEMLMSPSHKKLPAAYETVFANLEYQSMSAIT